MAVEKAAFDFIENGGMAESRQGLTDAVDELEKIVKSVSKRAVRQRIRKAADNVKFDVIVDPIK